MDYYEELGLRRTASSEEIHAAYRTLARLLHPDGQQHDQARTLAECQMRRLNQVFETLSSAASRANYDRRLDRSRKRHRHRVRAVLTSKAGAAVWGSTVAIAVVCLAFIFRDDWTQGWPAKAAVSERNLTGAHGAAIAPDVRIAALEREIEGLRRDIQRLDRRLSRAPEAQPRVAE